MHASAEAEELTRVKRELERVTRERDFLRRAAAFLAKEQKGTPQGEVLSPLLANLYLHYAFDRWMTRHYPRLPFCRYADDGLIHCRSLKQARYLKERLAQRLKECGLELHPDKTKVAYCKDIHRQHEYEHIQFDFLGYTFPPEAQ